MKLPFIIEKKLNGFLKPNLYTILTLESDNKTVKMFSKSLTANFIQFLYALFSNNSSNFVSSPAPFSSRVNGITAVAGNQSFRSFYPYANAGNGDLLKGMVFGTGTNPVLPSDSNLQSICAEGTGTNQLNYLAQTSIQGTEISGNVSNLKLQRIGTNNSGNDIVIREVGLFISYNSVNYQWLIFRELVNLTVPNTQTVTATLEFSITT